MGSLRIVLADDHALMRAGIGALLCSGAFPSPSTSKRGTARGAIPGFSHAIPRKFLLFGPVLSGYTSSRARE
jgi:hypothetical protein